MENKVVIEGEAPETDSDEDAECDTVTGNKKITNKMRWHDFVFSLTEWLNQSKGRSSPVKIPNRMTVGLCD